MQIGLTGEVRKIRSFRLLHVFEMAAEVATLDEGTARRHLVRELDEGRLSVKKSDRRTIYCKPSSRYGQM